MKKYFKEYREDSLEEFLNECLMKFEPLEVILGRFSLNKLEDCYEKYLNNFFKGTSEKKY